MLTFLDRVLNHLQEEYQQLKENHHGLCNNL